MSVYENIAEKYDERYAEKDFAHVAKYLRQFSSAEKALEIGCGTFHWSEIFKRNVFGVDASLEMLKHAKTRGLRICAFAENLPFVNSLFDFVYIVNALHQFENKLSALQETFRVMKSGGTFALVIPDFHSADFNWYVYEYFPQTYKRDLKRFPSKTEILQMLSDVGFENISAEVIHVSKNVFRGENVFNDKFLKKHNTSQLAALSDKEYEGGIEKIKRAIAENPAVRFYVNIPSLGIVASKSLDT